MVAKIGRNQNTNPVADVNTIQLNSTTATILSIENLKRIALGIDLEPGVSDIHVFIRLYPAARDNIKQGRVLLVNTMGNDTLFVPSWDMDPDNIYPGEISAITNIGTVDVFVTEY